MACRCTDRELPVWTCVAEVSTPGLRVEDFYSALDVWITRPQVASPRFLGAISLRIDSREDLQLLLCHYPSESTDQFFGSVWGVVEVMCRKLLPKQKHHSPIEELILIDKQCNSVTFLPLSSEICLSNEFLTRSSYKLRFSTSPEQDPRIVLCCLTQDFIVRSDNQVISPKHSIQSLHYLQATVDWLADTLLPKIVRWGEESIGCEGKEAAPTLQLISLEEYSEVYLRLKEKYSHQFIKIWPESTDPIKFVCEDIGIASYLIVLWQAERRDKGRKNLQSFLDLGCGNGLLTHILNQEGYPGRGVDMRKRKIWSLYGDSTNLMQSTFIPSEEAVFDSDLEWIIGNHSDELTPWIPYITSRSSYEMNYFVIPCCAYDFYCKFNKREGNQSVYRSYLEYVREIGEVCGFKVEQDNLRIPSTKKVCQIGRTRTYPEEESTQINKRKLNFIRGRPDCDVPPVPPKRSKLSRETGGVEEGVFTPREAIQAVRNCSKKSWSLQMEVVSTVANTLIEMSDYTGDDWNVGGELSIRSAVELFPKDRLLQLKNEHGGLQTLLKNHHQIFSVRFPLLSPQSKLLIRPVSRLVRSYSEEGSVGVWDNVMRRLECTIAEQKETKKKYRSSFELKKISQVSSYLSKRMLSKSNKKAEKAFPVYSEHYFYCVVDALVSLGKLNTAWDFVLSCQRHSIKLSSDTSNCLLWGLVEASEGNESDKFLKLWEFTMENDNLTYDGFASKVFYHSKHSDLHNVEATLSHMRRSGLDPGQLVRKSKLTASQVMAVTEALTKVEPWLDYISVPQEHSIPNLLRDLYRDQDGVKARGIECLIGIISPGDLALRLTEQLQMEKAGYLDIPSIAPRNNKSNNKIIQQLQASKSELFQNILKAWTNELTQAIQVEQEQLTRELDLPPTEKGHLGPVPPNNLMFLSLLPADTLADILINMVALPILSRGGYGVSVYPLVQDIGRTAWTQYIIKKKDSACLHSQLVDVYSEYLKLFTDPSLAVRYSPREYWSSLIKCHLNTLHLPYPRWSSMVSDPFSFHLLYLLVDKLSMPRTHPAQSFSSNEKPFLFVPPTSLPDKRGVPGMIVPNRHLYRFYKIVNRNRPETIRLSSGVFPSLVPPKPWCNTNDGGFLVTPTSLVNNNNDSKIHEISLKNEKLMGVYDALNILGNCPWKINQPILDHVIDVYRAGGSGRLGVAVKALEPKVGPEWDPQLTPEEFRKQRLSHRHDIKTSMEAYSLHVEMLYRLSVANMIREKVFWMPHFLDFRGRAYTFSSTVSHLGGDPQRGIMKFAVGKPLGPRGLDWLKIHAINLTGLHKKSPIHTRLSAADELMGEIIDSADRPMEGRGWWKEGDEPWQVLATCKEIRQALDSVDPEKFVSHIPIHQDGSCNGLQHYAALGGDAEGATNVNLTPALLPADVYSQVAMLVEKFRVADAEKGVKTAKKLEGLITRRVVKQSVMTEVYGVTFIGAREQVETQLAEVVDWSPKELFVTSTYVVKLMFKTMHEMFKNAKQIQNWLAKCATLISKYEPIEWETPLGLLCIQPYHKTATKRISTKLQKNLRIIHYSELTNKPDVLKQRNGFPPNFIHSLDSCHMMLTSLYCQREGITFVAIHDCYWTHAATVERMGAILREQFIRLHSEPILANLSEHLVEIFAHKIKDKELEHLKNIPVKGTFAIKEVLKSQYFFS